MTKVLHFSCVFLFITSVLIDTTMAQDKIYLGLQEAVDMALKNNAEIAIAKYEINSSAYSVKEAKSNYLPKVTLNSSYNRNIDRQVIFLPEGFGGGGATKIGSDNNFTSYLDLSLPLFSKYNAVNKEYATSNFYFQREALRGIRQTITVNVKKGYCNHLMALAIVKVRQKGLENAIENFNNIESKLLQGVATEFDEKTALVKIAAARNNLLQAQTQIIPASNNLKLLLGLPMETEIDLTDSLALKEEESIYLQDQIPLHQNSKLRQMDLKVDVAKRQTSIVKAAYFPTLSAIGSYQFQSQENSFDFPQYRWVKTSIVGLRLQVPLFNGMATRSRVRQAMEGEKIAAAQREYISNNNQAQSRQLLSLLNYPERLIELQNENLSIAEKALELVKERYHYGKGTFLEVNNAELEYIAARLAYLQAVVDYRYAYYDFELLTGTEN
jgi:outer membrane protein